MSKEERQKVPLTDAERAEFARLFAMRMKISRIAYETSRARETVRNSLIVDGVYHRSRILKDVWDTPDVHQTVADLFAQGLEYKVIAKRAGLTKYLVSAIVKKLGLRPPYAFKSDDEKPEPAPLAAHNSPIRLRGFTPEAALPYIQRFGAHRVEVLP